MGRFEEQSHEIKEAQEKMAEIVLAKQAKKGVDMERLALGPGGKPSKHPPKKQMVTWAPRPERATGATTSARTCTRPVSTWSGPRCSRMCGRPSSARGWKTTMLEGTWMASLPMRRFKCKHMGVDLYF